MNPSNSLSRFQGVRRKNSSSPSVRRTAIEAGLFADSGRLRGLSTVRPARKHVESAAAWRIQTLQPSRRRR